MPAHGIQFFSSSGMATDPIYYPQLTPLMSVIDEANHTHADRRYCYQRYRYA